MTTLQKFLNGHLIDPNDREIGGDFSALNSERSYRFDDTGAIVTETEWAAPENAAVAGLVRADEFFITGVNRTGEDRYVVFGEYEDQEVKVSVDPKSIRVYTGTQIRETLKTEGRWKFQDALNAVDNAVMPF